MLHILPRPAGAFELADEVTVLKDGRYVATRQVAGVTMDELVRLMIGRDLQDVYPKRTTQVGEVVLEVKNVSRSKLVHNINFQLRAGEIVGFAGITGSGRTEVARAIFGADASNGEMVLFGKEYKARSPEDAIHRGIALVTEDRKRQGLLLKQNVTINTTVSGLKQFTRFGLIRLGEELKLVK